MNKIISFDLVTETLSKDTTGQTTKKKTYQPAIGKQYSVYQKEFYQASQNGLRPEGTIEMSVFDYGGQKAVRIDNCEFAIYRTYAKGTDRIELFYGERVGNG